MRRSRGARRRHIFLRFLAESVALSGIGSFISALLGIRGAFAIPPSSCFSNSCLGRIAASAFLLWLTGGYAGERLPHANSAYACSDVPNQRNDASRNFFHSS
jgi:ABC-type antimicrobial peptide transport system permease subunit